MKVFTVAIVLIIVEAAISLPAANRHSRESGFVQVIRNTSFPCITYLSNESLHHVELSPHDMEAYFEDQGGQLIKSYMARDLDEASAFFTNLLSFTEKSKTKILDRFQESSNRLLKRLVLQYIRSVTNHSHSRESSYEKSNDISNEDKQPPGHDSRDRVQRFGERHQRGKSGTSRHRREVDDIPVALPESLGIPEDVQTDEGESHIDYCFERGYPTADNLYLHMCTTCQRTTDLGENKWPRYLNEATCSDEDPSCLIVDSAELNYYQAHGRCKQTTMPMNLFRKREGYCVMALQNGETVVVDEWELYQYGIRVGCECTVNVNSYFANFV